MKMALFWDAERCSLVEVYRRVRGTCWLQHQGDLPETSVNLYQTTRCNVAEDGHLHTRRQENWKFHLLKQVFTFPYVCTYMTD
jgi:hypothetical protein